nr:Chain C, GLY-PHE-GLY-LEU-PHE-ASP [Homo sapiens]5GU4_D Chain D, GLY-PHE-GLY-LEU-PHE-ASP [Homo sapiens]
DDMGFGLFD